MTHPSFMGPEMRRPSDEDLSRGTPLIPGVRQKDANIGSLDGGTWYSRY